MSLDLQITPAAKADIPALNKLVNSAYRGETSKKGWTTEADLLDGIRTDPEALEDMMEQPGAVILKCTDSTGALRGCVFLRKTDKQLYLGMLTVLPELQGSGVGKQLLKASEAYAREQGCDRIVMSVISVRRELIAWYERKGYRATGEKRPFPTDPRFGIPKQELEFVIMEKPVGKAPHSPEET
jgi:ribosomal protein S18 acetylase RimI-like enzyme